MPTIAEQLTQLESDRQDLVSNLQTKGITGLTGDETFTTLVPEVLNIPTGGGVSVTFYNPTITQIKKLTKGSSASGTDTYLTIGNPNLIPVKNVYLLKFDGTREELTINNTYTGYRWNDANDIQTIFTYSSIDGQKYISMSRCMPYMLSFGFDGNQLGIYIVELDESKCEFLNNSTYIGIDIGSNITSTTIGRISTNTTNESVSLIFTGCWSSGYISNQSSIGKYIVIPNFINW